MQTSGGHHYPSAVQQSRVARPRRARSVGGIADESRSVGFGVSGAEVADRDFETPPRPEAVPLFGAFLTTVAKCGDRCTRPQFASTNIDPSNSSRNRRSNS